MERVQTLRTGVGRWIQAEARRGVQPPRSGAFGADEVGARVAPLAGRTAQRTRKTLSKSDDDTNNYSVRPIFNINFHGLSVFPVSFPRLCFAKFHLVFYIHVIN